MDLGNEVDLGGEVLFRGSRGRKGEQWRILETSASEVFASEVFAHPVSASEVFASEVFASKSELPRHPSTASEVFAHFHC